jgi:hypothetical protein
VGKKLLFSSDVFGLSCLGRAIVTILVTQIGSVRTPEHNPADLLACLGLRAQLRLEQRRPRSKDGNRL